MLIKKIINEIKYEIGSWLIPLWARQQDFNSEDSVLNDEQSEQIIEKLNPDFSAFEKCSDIVKNLTIASIVSRNIIINSLLEDILINKENVVVVNLGCGLDTKNFLFQSKVSTCYNIDLEPIINLRKNIFDEDSINISCNFLSFEWLHEVKEVSERQNVIFLAEGLFMYFEKSVVSDFLMRLKKGFPKSDLIFESVGILGKNYLHPMLSALGVQEKYKWGDSSKNIEIMFDGKAENIISTLSEKHPKWGIFRKLFNLPLGIKHLVFSTIYHFKL